MKFFFVINPKAGKKHDDIMAMLKDHPAAKETQWEAAYTEHAGHASEIAAAAVKNGYNAIIAAGGDGTIQETAKGILGTGAVFGLLPCGSGNGLARNLKIPLDINKAIDGVFNWKAKPTDAGMANGRLFLVSCGAGLDAEVAHCFNSQSHGRGILPYVWHAVRIYFTYKPKSFSAIIDGKELAMKELILTALVGEQYGGGAKIAPNAVSDDGLLDLCSVKPVNTLRLLISLPSLFNGTITKNSDIYNDIRCKEFILNAGEPFWFHLDGEDFYSETGKLEVKSMPAAFNIIRP
ncbi:MAG: diacylglycerol kinase family lipid kinase [Elusimicrobiales bacterium]|nr:diacylglycerol kinase family lipid kinase [Elusimicrobiales bacterium]